MILWDWWEGDSLKPHSWLWPLSIPYRVGVGLRNYFYDSGLISVKEVDSPVVSVGNISVGGTGKTPFVIYLSELVKELTGTTRKTAVVTRGFKGSNTGTLIVSDGRRILADFWSAGDEPVLISESSSGTIVVVDKDRARGAAMAVSELRAKMIILDDGFQHRKLKRDLDIVLLDAQDPFGNRLCLPAGYLREPPSALNRADLVVFSKANTAADEMKTRAEKLEQLVKKPVIVSHFEPQYWRKIDNSELLQPEEISGKRVVAFAGLANPGSFFDSVVALGAEIVKEIPLPDHCNYSKSQLDKISLSFARYKADWLVTTSKDAIKLPPILRFLPLYTLESRMRVIHGEEVLKCELTKLMS